MKKKKNTKFKNKKKMREWEKKFIFFNILAIFIICFIYGYKLIYYYRIEHQNSFENVDNLYEALTNSNIVYTGDGLYKVDNDNFYYKGKDVNNYIYYLGRSWRIISIDKDGILIICENNQTSIVWGYNSNYPDSYIYKWLNEDVFIKSLGDYDNILVENDFCYEFEKNEKSLCNNSIKSYVGLLSVYEYMRSGGSEGFINNSSFFWTINKSDNDKVYYIFDKGGINDESNDLVSYYSFGVRPVIKLGKETPLISGDGSIDNPFIIENNSSIMLVHKDIGSYIEYSNYVWRITDINDNYIKVILDGVLENEFNYNNALDFINGEFYNSLDKSLMVKCDFNKGNLGEDNNYIATRNDKITNFIGLSSIGDLFITDYENYWLYNGTNSDNNLKYTVNDKGRMFLDTTDDLNKVRPSICLNINLSIKDGKGISDNPYLLEVSDETNN